jgi:putative transposase
LTPLLEREQVVTWIQEAVVAGARRWRACEEAGLSLRTLQRWVDGEEKVKVDARATNTRPEPKNKLSALERQRVLNVCNSAEYAQLPPSQIVPRLADQGVYIASESTFYRLLKEHGQSHRRGRAQAPGKHKPPTSYTATAANQVWSWDITYLPTRVRGRFYYLYLFEDIYSRKAVGAEVYELESGELAAGILQRIVITEQCFGSPPVLHPDNGAPMKSLTLLAKIYDLGLTPSRGRPRVSNDNPYSESLFRTLKYCPQWPADGFESIEAARLWVRDFVEWYNEQHCHSRIRFVTPGQRHRGEDKVILKKRQVVYENAKQQRPERWSGSTRNWGPVGSVNLNPEREKKLLKIAA